MLQKISENLIKHLFSTFWRQGKKKFQQVFGLTVNMRYRNYLLIHPLSTFITFSSNIVL